MLSRNPAPFFKHHVITGYAIYILVTSHNSSSSKTKEKKIIHAIVIFRQAFRFLHLIKYPLCS